MVLFFVILGIPILALLIFVILILSTIKIQIKNLEVGNIEAMPFRNTGNAIEDIWKLKNENATNKRKSKINDKYEIKISLKFLEKIPIWNLKFNKEKVEKIRKSKSFKKIDIQKITKKIKQNEPTKKETLQALRSIKIRLEELNLIVYIGTEDSIITSYATAFIATVIGIALPHLAEKNINNCRYKVIPIYHNKNEYNISLDGIICIKIVHIISNMFNLIRKGRGKKHERTSNRRSYAYRYE